MKASIPQYSNFIFTDSDKEHFTLINTGSDLLNFFNPPLVISVPASL